MFSYLGNNSSSAILKKNILPNNFPPLLFFHSSKPNTNKLKGELLFNSGEKLIYLLTAKRVTSNMQIAGNVEASSIEIIETGDPRLIYLRALSDSQDIMINNLYKMVNDKAKCKSCKTTALFSSTKINFKIVPPLSYTLIVVIKFLLVLDLLSIIFLTAILLKYFGGF
jgi:hypothetical protein